MPWSWNRPSVKKMIPSKLTLCSTSDVHLGHPNTVTRHILKNLRTAFPNGPEMEDVDLMLICGDLFDRPLSWHDEAVDEIEHWMAEYLRMCKRRGITVRVLEGTPSHDWRQNKHLARVNEQAAIGAELKYIDTLSIEYIEKFGIHVLYVPDEWAPEPDEVWRQVQQLLQEHSLQQVDFTVLHGTWDFQLPEFVKTPRHTVERYAAITRHYIFSGHVHIPCHRGKVINNGSFDRLCHGEEHAKGHWRVTVNPQAGDRIVFVENHGAQIYKTVDCTGVDIDVALERLQIASQLPAGSYLRVQAARQDPIFSSLDTLRKQYPKLHWSTKPTEQRDDVQRNMLVDLRPQFTQLNITPQNVKELLMTRLQGLALPPAILTRSEHRLSEFLS